MIWWCQNKVLLLLPTDVVNDIIFINVCPQDGASQCASCSHASQMAPAEGRTWRYETLAGLQMTPHDKECGSGFATEHLCDLFIELWYLKCQSKSLTRLSVWCNVKTTRTFHQSCAEFVVFCWYPGQNHKQCTYILSIILVFHKCSLCASFQIIISRYLKNTMFSCKCLLFQKSNPNWH